MKIFGKRKSSNPSPKEGGIADNKPDEAPTAPSTSDDNIPSYFSGSAEDGPKKKKAKKNPSNEINGDEMETLLKMDFEKLNSKQRRLVRRYKERSGEDVAEENVAAAAAAASGGGNDANNDADDNKKEDNSKQSTKDKDSSKAPELGADEPKDIKEKELLTKLSGLNSKDRRKFLRQLKSENPHNFDIDKLEEEAKRIAERNILDSKEEKVTPKKSQPKQPAPTPTPTSTASKKKKAKDLSHLPPEEIARREKQRQLQIEAAERRARGEDTNNGHKHPLNSERRRANRRKPARKSQVANKGGAKREFNSVGYMMRKNA
jgi:hypothetical protein